MTRRALLSSIAGIALLAIGLGVTAGCTVSYYLPVARVMGVTLTGVGLGGATVQLDLDLYNPNNEELPVREVEFEVSVGGSGYMPGHAVLQQPLPPLQNTPVSVNVAIGPIQAATGLVGLLGGRRDYHVRGTAYVDTPVGEMDVDFEQTGDVRQL